MTKKITRIAFLYLLLTTITLSVNAQYFPFGMNYQAVARDIKGYPISNSEIVLEISILKGVSNDIVWQETHIGTTDKFGSLNIVIGEGTSTLVGSSPDFKSIDWVSEKHFVKVRADFGDEDFINGMVNLGTSPLQAVPYALVAARAIEAPLPKLSDVVGIDEATLSINDALAWDGSAWEAGTFFLASDGSTDLLGDWTISSNNINLTGGTLLANALKTNLGPTISEFSIDPELGTSTAPSDNVVSTEKAVKTYVDGQQVSMRTYVDTKFASTWALSIDNASLFNVNQRIGIGTNTPLDKFHASIGKAGFLVTGDLDVNLAVNTQVGSSLMFFPSRSAFRAGTATAAQWSNANIGEYSTAFGKDNQASNGGAFAFGYNNVASGSQSLVGGHSNLAKEVTSVAFGQNNQALGRSSFVMGENLVANSYAEIIFGTYNEKKFSPGPDPINFQSSDLLFVIANGTLSERKNAFTVMKDGNIGIHTKTATPPTSDFQVNGSMASKIETITTGVTLTDENNIILADASAGNMVITLPSIDKDAFNNYKCLGREYTIKKVDGTVNFINIVGTAANIDGQANFFLQNQWDFVKIINDGIQWYIIGTN